MNIENRNDERLDLLLKHKATLEKWQSIEFDKTLTNALLVDLAQMKIEEIDAELKEIKGSKA